MSHLQTALDAARAAGEIIRRYYREDIEVHTKADASPVTAADVEAEEVIRSIVRARHPDHGFYGEETGRERDDAEYLWLVDPLDGTRSFVRHYPFFSTQIALRHRSELVLGVSSAPLMRELAWAEKGQGAWLDGTRIGVSELADLAESTLSTGNLRTLAGSPQWAGLGRLVKQVARIRGYGDFYHYHLLAAGRIDAVIESDVNILDIAALTVIVREAGGRVTDLEGEDIGLETRSIVATNGRLHDAVLGAM